MTYLRKPKFWLLTTAALIFGSHMSATAQVPGQVSNVYPAGSYQAGAPTMVAAAPSLPTISADQIARDVTAEFNPRTGRTELIAAPFDPFEEDPNMAGSLKLRSADDAVSVDGQPLRGGALVDIDFFYNSPSDDPYGGRNYGDASFVSGELAPVVLRDTRVLECSTLVNNVVYEHNVYYSPLAHRRYSIYRPYRHYAGHSGFGFGFGTSYFGPGIRFYNNNRSRHRRLRRDRGHSHTRAFLPLTNLPNAGRRGSTDRGGSAVAPVRGGRTAGSDRNNDRNSGTTPSTRRRSTPPSAREVRQRIGGVRANATELRNGGRAGARRSITADPSLRVAPAPTASRNQSTIVSERAETSSSASSTPAVNSATRFQSSRRDLARNAALSGRGTTSAVSRSRGGRTSTPKVSTPKVSTPQRSAPARSSTPKPSRSSSRSTPKPSSRSSRSSSSRSSSSRSSSKPSRSSSSSRSTPSRSSRSVRSRLNFFPSRGQSSRQVVTSQNVDCAREDKLSVFIPNDRLDAARFDGLTLIALDAQGGETPIYIPPNYIQGYRMAATGRVQPQGYTAAPQPQLQPRAVQPVYPQSPQIEAAPCPAGTSKQADGTCLQTSVSGYPAR